MDDLARIPSRLSDIWKDFFGLYTQYVGYLTPEMIKTILQIKRSFDSALDERFDELNLIQLNEFAARQGYPELPNRKEISDVLPHIWNYLKEYDFSDFSVSSEKWNELMGYLDKKRQ